MAWWISGGIVLLALVWLIVTLARVLGSLRRFAVVAQSLQRRLLDGEQRLRPRLEQLQHQAESMQGSLLVAAERAAAMQAKRGAAEGASAGG